MNIKRTNGTETITDYTQQEWLQLRSRDITSTDAAALFGISPYLTPFELWHRKKNRTIVELEPNERMRWGTRLQDAIAAGICEDNGWTEWRRKDEYIRRVKIAMGSSFDYEVMLKGEMPLLEIKNVDSLSFKDHWVVDGNSVIEAPMHIELQAQHQLAVAERKIIYIAALIGGNRVVMIQRERDEKVIAQLETRISDFWNSIDRNQEPPPDFVRDADFIKTLYKYAEPGKMVQGTAKMGEMVVAYKALGSEVKSAKEKQDAIKAELLTMIGDAEKVIGDTFNISAGMIGPSHIEYDREGYRDFRVTLKKEKANARN